MAVRSFLRLFLTLTLGVIVGTLKTNAHADITIAGGTTAQQAAVKNVYGALPACCHTSCSVSVQLLGNEAMDSYLQSRAAAQGVRLVNAASVDGLFQNKASTITVRGAGLPADISATFAHEYGHFVWLNVLSQAQRDQYRKIYDAQRATHHLVSQYAAISVEEGFAEAFCFYVLNRSTLSQRDSCSCCFLDGFLAARDQKAASCAAP